MKIFFKCVGAIFISFVFLNDCFLMQKSAGSGEKQEPEERVRICGDIEALKGPAGRYRYADFEEKQRALKEAKRRKEEAQGALVEQTSEYKYADIDARFNALSWVETLRQRGSDLFLFNQWLLDHDDIGKVRASVERENIEKKREIEDLLARLDEFMRDESNIEVDRQLENSVIERLRDYVIFIAHLQERIWANKRISQNLLTHDLAYIPEARLETGIIGSNVYKRYLYVLGILLRRQNVSAIVLGECDQLIFYMRLLLNSVNNMLLMRHVELSLQIRELFYRVIEIINWYLDRIRSRQLRREAHIKQTILEGRLLSFEPTVGKAGTGRKSLQPEKFVAIALKTKRDKEYYENRLFDAYGKLYWFAPDSHQYRRARREMVVCNEMLLSLRRPEPIVSEPIVVFPEVGVLSAPTRGVAKLESYERRMRKVSSFVDEVFSHYQDVPDVGSLRARDERIRRKIERLLDKYKKLGSSGDLEQQEFEETGRLLKEKIKKYREFARDLTNILDSKRKEMVSSVPVRGEREEPFRLPTIVVPQKKKDPVRRPPVKLPPIE